MKTLEKAKRRRFRSEDAERAFWSAHSPLEFFDASKAHRARFSRLRPSVKSISIRLPEALLVELMTLANKRDIPYQSLAKLYLAWGVRAERKAMGRK